MPEATPWRFQFKLINTLVMLVGVSVCLYLAYWQAGRVAEKTLLQARHDALLHATPWRLNDIDEASLANLTEHAWQPVSVEGVFLPQYAFFLDSQVYQGKAGYHYIVPLHIPDNNTVILVNLGWISAGADRQQLPEFPEITTPQPITGQLAKPRAAMARFQQHSDAALQLFINFEALSARIAAAEKSTFVILPMILQLDEQASGGLPRAWPKFDANIAMHEFYVAHWLIAALLIVLLYVYFARKKPPQD